MKICILIPVYNESKNIGSVVAAVRNLKFDVVVVDDGSTDNSGAIALKNGAKVIRNDQKNGKGYSLQKGFEYIIKQGYDGVIIMDGDAQHATEDLELFTGEANIHPQSIVTGNRMKNAKGMPLVRYATNRFMSFLISWACHQSVADTQCGYRYIGADVLRNINLRCNSFEIETEMLIEASRKGYKIYSVPIRTIYGDETSHIHPVKDTIRFFNYFIKEVFFSNKKYSP